MAERQQCALINSEKELKERLSRLEYAFVLFYASWCPYSRKFLPVFEIFSENRGNNCFRLLLDDNEHLAEKYSIEVYPTVLFFNKGKVYRRLDGTTGEGLNGKKLTDFAAMCNAEGGKNG